MSIYETKAFIANGLPPGIKISATATLIFYHLCLQYDTRPGKKKSYPGMEELQRVTGKGRTTCQDALGVLLKAGLITQVQRGYRTKRAEYVPTYALELLKGNSVVYTDTLEDKVLPILAHSVTSTDDKSHLDRLKGSPIPYAISTSSTYKYDTCNKERFDFIIQGVPTHLRNKVTPGKNLEELLDELDLIKVSREAIRDKLNQTYWDNVRTPGAIIGRVLTELIDDRKGAIAKHELDLDHRRLVKEEQEEQTKKAVAPEVAGEYAKQIRQLWSKNAVE